jgi:hypothetical protein
LLAGSRTVQHGAVLDDGHVEQSRVRKDGEQIVEVTACDHQEPEAGLPGAPQRLHRGLVHDSVVRQRPVVIGGERRVLRGRQAIQAR